MTRDKIEIVFMQKLKPHQNQSGHWKRNGGGRSVGNKHVVLQTQSDKRTHGQTSGAPPAPSCTAWIRPGQPQPSRDCHTFLPAVRSAP